MHMGTQWLTRFIKISKTIFDITAFRMNVSLSTCRGLFDPSVASCLPLISLSGHLRKLVCALGGCYICICMSIQLAELKNRVSSEEAFVMQSAENRGGKCNVSALHRTCHVYARAILG